MDGITGLSKETLENSLLSFPYGKISILRIWLATAVSLNLQLVFRSHWNCDTLYSYLSHVRPVANYIRKTRC